MRRLRVIPAVLAAVLLLCACGRADSARDVEALRLRVERLEREAAEDRARQAEDLTALRREMAALRESLDNASQRLAELGGQEVPVADRPAKKSPRAALKASLRGAYESSRQALDRLGRQLDHALTRKPTHAAAPADKPE